MRRSLNYRSGSYTAPKPPRYRTRGGGYKPAGRWVNAATGRPGGRGRMVFQPGVNVNAGRDRGTAFVRYKAPKPKPKPIRTSASAARPAPAPAPAPTPTPPDPRYPTPPTPPQPRPPADTISPGQPGRVDGGGRELRIRESPARRTAFRRGDRARGSRRSARVGGIRARGRASRSTNRLARSVGGLGKAARSRLGINV
jgi:hypothetical protein